MLGMSAGLLAGCGHTGGQESATASSLTSKVFAVEESGNAMSSGNAVASADAGESKSSEKTASETDTEGSEEASEAASFQAAASSVTAGTSNTGKTVGNAAAGSVVKPASGSSRSGSAAASSSNTSKGSLAGSSTGSQSAGRRSSGSQGPTGQSGSTGNNGSSSNNGSGSSNGSGSQGNNGSGSNNGSNSGRDGNNGSGSGTNPSTPSGPTAYSMADITYSSETDSSHGSEAVDATSSLAGLFASQTDSLANFQSLFSSDSSSDLVSSLFGQVQQAGLSQLSKSTRILSELYDGSGYIVNFVYYQEGNASTARSFVLKMVQENGQWKLQLNSSAQKDISSVEYSGVNTHTNGYYAARNAGRNVATMADGNYLYSGTTSVYSGTTASKAIMAWQEENGDVVVGVWLANGTSSDVSYSSISLSLTDENQVLSGSCAMSVTVPAGTGKMVFVRVPAASVYTGTATWSSLTGTVTVS